MPCDYSKYPPNWKTEIRPRILYRAGERRLHDGTICLQARCEFCNVPNNSLVIRGLRTEDWTEVTGFAADVAADDGEKVVRIVLTIAHLDHDASNWDVEDDRLKALCQKCHNSYDVEFRRSNRERKKGNLKLF